MTNSHQFFCILLLFLSTYQIKGSTLLNITNEALSTGQQLIEEIEKREIYNNITDLKKKMEKIHNIFASFLEKNDRKDIHDAGMILAESNDFLKESILFKNVFINYYDLYVMVELVAEYPEDNMYIFLKEPIRENQYNFSTTYKTLGDVLNKYHEIFQINNPDTGTNIVTELAKFSPFAQSQQEILIVYGRSVALLDAFGYSMMQYCYAISQVITDGINLGFDLNHLGATIDDKWTYENVIEKMYLLEKKFEERNEKTLSFVKNFVSVLPRESWNRVLNNTYDFIGKIVPYQEDITYTKMHNVFQKYIINEVDLNFDGTCKKECSYYHKTKVHGCFNEKICAQQRTCKGNLWNCSNEINYPMNICASSKIIPSRYNFIEANGVYYGEKYFEAEKYFGEEKYCKSKLVETKSWTRGVFKCDYCTCTCDNEDLEGDRYFNLRDVTSDIESNYVVTNARFRKENNVIHIQIRQAELLPEARINSSSGNWKTIDSYNIHDKKFKNGYDYHTISWHQRTMCLDQITAPTNQVLTGLRFRFKDGYLKLEIQATPFDYKTGQLASPHMSDWFSNYDDFDFRSELDFFNRDKYVLNLESSQYFRFTTSDMKTDAGQDTIPYIDLESLHRIRGETPLSGFGIYHKNIPKIGDLLSLSAATYDYAPHII